MTALAQFYALYFHRARSFNEWQHALHPNFIMIPFICLLPDFFVYAWRPSKKKINCEYAHAYRLMITLYLWMQIIIILIKSSNVVSKFYRLLNTDTFNHLFFNSLNHLKNKSALICMYRISSNNPLTLTCTLTRISALSLGQHIKQLHHSLGQHIKQPPPPPPRISALSLDSRDTRETCRYWHLICNFLNFIYS